MQHKRHLFFKPGTLALSIAAAISISPSVFAADNPLEEIQVTGTRIRMTDGMAAPTPVTSVTPMELQAFEPGGSLADQLDALPQFFNTGSAQRGGPALWSDGGGSYLDMRGLGRNRTLVLLDGSRVAPADKRGNVNIDNFPTALMRSVDVVTGGASAAYGADALGGVTNFVLNREFEGLKTSVSAGVNEFDRDGQNANLSVAGGRQIGERLHVIGSVEARVIDEIYRSARDMDADWFRNYGYVTNPAYSASDPKGTNIQRLMIPWAASTTSNPTGIIYAPGSVLDGLTFNDDGSGVRPFVHGDISDVSVTSGGPEADRALDTRAPITGSGVKNRSGFLGLKYDVTDSFSVFGQALVGRAESSSLSEHTAFTLGGAGNSSYNMTIYRENPYLPQSVADIMDAEGMSSFKLSKNGNDYGKLAPGSHEYSKTVFTTTSWQVGFDAVLPMDWNLRASWQSGESKKRGGEYPSSRIDREALARDAVVDPLTGAIVCNVTLHNPSVADLAASPSIQGLTSSLTGKQLASPIGLDNSVRDCVPYNAMGEQGVSQKSWNYMMTPKIADSWVKQDFAEVVATGEIYDGWGYGPVSLAAGLTYREQSFADRALPESIDDLGPPRNDPALGIRGIPSYYSGLASSKNLHQFSTINKISGKYDVWEYFGELQAPIWESESGAQRIGGTMAYRSSDYSSSGRSESWKLGLDIQIIEDLRLRLTKSKDVREASFQERFDASTSGATVRNPWTGVATDNPTVASGGNPSLRPEIANTRVMGLVYQPSWLEGFSLSADYYDVDITDAVATLTAQILTDACFDSGSYCDKIVRDATTGAVVRVEAGYLNLARSTVRGIDYEASYRMEPNFFGNQSESLAIRAIVGQTMERRDISSTGGVTEYLGGYNNPEFTGNLMLNYSLDAWGIQWQQRFIDKSEQVVNWEEGVDIDNNHVPFYTTTNATLSYSGELDRGSAWRVAFSVTNLFDKNPPLILGSTGQIVASDYDRYGRRYQLSLNMDF